MKTKVGVIDIGSNTIKLLVAARKSDTLCEIASHYEECRISAGMNPGSTALSNEAINMAARAVQRLVRIARHHAVNDLRIVATSAVREAENGHRLITQVQDACDLGIQVLSGKEEATWIAFGLPFDSHIPEMAECIHFDLGGGSLEFNHIQNGRICDNTSLPLGAVRLTQAWISDPRQPVAQEDQDRIRTHVARTLNQAKLSISDQRLPLIFTGGSLSLSRKLLDPALSHGARIAARSLERLLHELSALRLEARIERFDIPPNRADVIPTALITVLAVLDHCQQDGLHHSFYGLRHGIAAKMLFLE